MEMPFLLLMILARYAALTRHSGLTQSTDRISVVAVTLVVDRFDQSVVISHTFALVVALFGDGTHRAALDAGSTAVFRHAVFIVRGIVALGRLQGEIDNDRTVAAGLTLGGDQSVAQTEGAETGDEGGVTLGPVGFFDKTLAVTPGELIGAHGSNRLVTKLHQVLFQRFSQSAVTVLAVDADHGPLQRRAVIYRSALLLGIGGVGQEPTDDADIRRIEGMTVNGLQPLRGQAVKIGADMFFVKCVPLVIAAAEANDGFVEGKSGKLLHVIILQHRHVGFDPLLQIGVVQFHGSYLPLSECGGNICCRYRRYNQYSTVKRKGQENWFVVDHKSC